ncbi:RecBCD enzyme subunit RecD [Candidatus Methylobacter favarea]|uniref:RecBCD enzyme subunit RecD n=1 Tax=Candidatus Methylobacter favarea TaxID=2707345 RepID=A0A8S0WHZ0_9GAMM|nr:exodeoxyribonuclease V subunit alpha [Candidatus Methylobacter favarea]CAA9890181.1 RecBCD enzyme subunit RecD [Candidatus Methylobacter favarea]
MQVDANAFSRLDIAFARFLSQRTKFDENRKQEFEHIVMRVSHEQNQGHSCIQLDDKSRALMLASGLAAVPAQPTGCLPLVVDQNRLYLHRYWFYENRLAMQIKMLTKINFPVENLDPMLERYFEDRGDETDWQREAAKMAVRQGFSIITGGPGTGKTTTVVKILALLQELAAEKFLHIALAAPTGKAAMRLQESIAFNKAALPCPEQVKEHIPATATTLHRLLGAKPPSPYFNHDAEKPLMYELVVMDEASMVDLALMSKLVDALKPGARLILLGDKDQLASVESGAALADLTMALPDHTVELKKSHRFDENIKHLADAVNCQQHDTAWQILRKHNKDYAVQEPNLIDYVAGQQAEYLQLIKAQAEFDEIYRAFSRFQVLCSNRHGKNSVADINYQVEQKLAVQKLINLSGAWYSGRPVLVTQNNAAMQLYNGDIGICMPDKEQDGKLMVFFQSADGAVKKYLPTRLPHCETVFAMTIHKSQGSEFEEVLIALPDTVNPVLTKELLYTAITRAKKTLKLVADEAVFAASLKQRVQRFTGLVDKFSNPD